MLKFYIKGFLGDGQGAVMRAILYADRSCFIVLLIFLQSHWIAVIGNYHCDVISFVHSFNISIYL